jgi:hypothetical protein
LTSLSSPREETRSNSKTRLLLRLGAAALAALLSQAIPAALIAAPVFAAKDPSSPSFTYTAAAWPSSWNAYKFADGTTIADPQGEPGISPDNVDISSDAGTQPSVYFAYDGTNAFFRLRVLGDPADSKKGGFDNAFWLVQLATTDNVVRAVVGLNGKPVDTDFVYVSNGDGSTVTSIYQTPFDPSANQQGARSGSDGSGQYFVDFQVPMSAIYGASGNTISAATPIHLVFGTSQAANLATINKDGLVPSSNYSSLGAPELRGPTNTTTTVDCTPSDSVTYGSAKTCTVTVTDNAATEPSQPTGSVSLTSTYGDLSASSCTLAGATTSTSTCTVTFTGSAVGTGTVGATFPGDGAHDASSGSTNVTVSAATLTVTANDKGRLVGEPDPSFDAQYDGFVGSDDPSVLGGSLSCSSTATGASPAGDYSISCSGLTSVLYEINFVDGTLSVGKATPVITSGTPPTLTYGDGLPDDPTGGDAANVPGTFSFDVDPGTVLHVGGHTVHVTFTPTDTDRYTTVEYDVTVNVTPAPLTITAQDAQRNEGDADPTFTVKYDAFVNGDDETSLTGTLSCTTDATSDSTAGNYDIQCSGLSSDDYDVKYVDGVLAVEATDNGGGNQPTGDTTDPAASAPHVAFITGSTITAKRLVPVRTTWTASDDNGLSQTFLQRSVGNKSYVQVADVSCPTGTTYDAHYDSNVAPRKELSEQTQAEDTSSNTSGWQGGTPFWVNDYQINSHVLQYTGKWHAVYTASYWMGGVKGTTKPGATVSLTANGSAFAFVTSVGPNMGQVEVTLDGESMGVIDLYAPVATDRYVAWSTSFADFGSHTLTVTALGTKNPLSTSFRIVLDAFAVIGDAPVKPGVAGTH